MALVLADWLTTRLPEYPRLRLLELGAGTGLVASSLQKRGHDVVITDGKDEVLVFRCSSLMFGETWRMKLETVIFGEEI